MSTAGNERGSGRPHDQPALVVVHRLQQQQNQSLIVSEISPEIIGYDKKLEFNMLVFKQLIALVLTARYNIEKEHIEFEPKRN